MLWNARLESVAFTGGTSQLSRPLPFNASPFVSPSIYSLFCGFQAIKLLGCEKGKKGKVNVLFVAGTRLLSCFNTCYEREKVMTLLLKLVGSS